MLPEVVVEVTDFCGDYEGKLWRVRDEVHRINRTNERKWVATARVHVVVSDCSVRFLELGIWWVWQFVQGHCHLC